MEYNKQYFLDKFNALKDEEMGEGFTKNCALWQCGVRIGKYLGMDSYVPTEESTALIKLLGGQEETDWRVVYRINDATNEYNTDEYNDLTPLQRILKRLNELPD